MKNTCTKQVFFYEQLLITVVHIMLIFNCLQNLRFYFFRLYLTKVNEKSQRWFFFNWYKAYVLYSVVLLILEHFIM